MTAVKYHEVCTFLEFPVYCSQVCKWRLPIGTVPRPQGYTRNKLWDDGSDMNRVVCITNIACVKTLGVWYYTCEF